MDLRIEHIFNEAMRGDTSFQERQSGIGWFFGHKKYTEQEMRATWQEGVRRGIEIGLRKASLEGQRVELQKNTVNQRHREFIEKFYQLAEEYKCGIQYHPEFGMVVISRSNPG